MTLFIQELLCINETTGAASVAHLTIEDDDDSLTSEEVGAVYTLDGVVMGANPVVATAMVDLTLLNGTIRQKVAMSFVEGGNRYYFLDPDMPADNVTAAANYTQLGIVGSIGYAGYGATRDETPRPYQAQALIQYFDGSGTLQAQEVNALTVFDDDNKIELASETGADALGHVVYNGQEGPFFPATGYPLVGVGDTNLRLVTVDYDGPNGSGSFQAIEYTLPRFGSTLVSYVPLKGSVDLADVGTITGTTLLAGSLEGVKYADYGLGFATTVRDGTSGADVMTGSWLHDEFDGKNGADTLVGSNGEDKLFGGGGADSLFGGQHADTLEGGAGGDVAWGRSYHDELSGGDGADSLYGGWGSDTLDGGKKADSLQGDQDSDDISGGSGDDTLLGADGNDTLDGGADDDDLRGGIGDDELVDGTGSDTLTGNNGADTFIFGTDGATDTLADFKDGIDLIDVIGTFGSLTFTDVAPGEVHVTHGGETLIIFDTTGTLTSADLTRADFV